MAVRESSREAHSSLDRTGYFSEKETIILSLFVDHDTRLTRQDIADATEKLPGQFIPINTVCGRVNVMVKKGLLIEDGYTYGLESGKRQMLLRRFNPNVDSEEGMLKTKYHSLQADLLALEKNELVLTSSGGKVVRRYTSEDGEDYLAIKAMHKVAMLTEQEHLLTRLREVMSLPDPGADGAAS